MEEEKSLNQEVPLETIYRHALRENARLNAEIARLESKVKKQEKAITAFKEWQRKVAERNYEYWIASAKDVIRDGIDVEEANQLLNFFKSLKEYKTMVKMFEREKKKLVKRFNRLEAKYQGEVNQNEDDETDNS